MQLFITEKPSVAADVARALNGNFQKKDGFFESQNTIITWCYGHLLKSLEPEGYNSDYAKWHTKDLPLKLHPIKYEPIADKKAHTEKVISLIKKADVIIHAGDPDDEGQLLVDELLLYAGNTKPVKRLLINDNTEAAIKKALANLQDNDKFKGLFLKALARTTGDLIYGLSMTRAYTIAGRNKGYQGLLSVGRVQTPILGLIARRWIANQSHSTSFYYTLTGKFCIDSKIFNANWNITELAPQDDKKRLISKDYAQELAARLTGKQAIIKSAEIQDKETAPPLPFNLVRLQQHMNKKFKLTAAKTLEITQQLREKHKAITYNRSDCSYLSEEQFQEAPQLLAALKAADNQLAELPINVKLKSKAFNSEKVTAHTAIIPTSKVPNLQELSIDEKNVYKAILDQYIVQFLPNKLYKEVSIIAVVDGETFSTKARKTIDTGFSSYLKGDDIDNSLDNSDIDDPDETTNAFEILETLSTGQIGSCDSVTVNEKKTTAPPLFTEASLLSALVRVADFVENPKIKSLLKEKDKHKKDEHGGIGTPATRSEILEKLKTRQFITIEKGKLIPTQTGLNFFHTLPTAATLPDMTALWSDKQTDIAQGIKTIDDFVNDLILDLHKQISTISVANIQGEKKISNTEKLTTPCPNCGKEIAVFPKLFACSNCDFKIWSTVAEKKITKSMVETLLKKGKTSEITGFKSKTGKTFSAKLTLQDKTTGKVGFVF